MPNLTNIPSMHFHIPFRGLGLIGGDVPGPPFQREEPEDLGNVEAGYGFVPGVNKDGRVILLGGNQGNAVNLSPNGTSSVIQYVYPNNYTPSNLPLPQYNIKGRSLSNATSR